MTIPRSKSYELAFAIGRGLADVFVSPNVCDSNGEAANVVDTLDDIARALHRIASALEKGCR